MHLCQGILNVFHKVSKSLEGEAWREQYSMEFFVPKDFSAV